MGVSSLLAHLREFCWIVKARQRIKSILRKCVTCKRFRGRPGEQEMAPLPAERITKGAPFQTVGIDFAGPLYVREGCQSSKAYICLFTCATTRAVHLELVGSLSTHSFLASFRRFISRRGLPKVIISDNALAFHRASKELRSIWKTLVQKEVKEYFSGNHIEWKFNIPRAPWHGGFFERMIQTVKGCLKKILGKSSLNFESLETVLCEIEAVINSRPICIVTDSIEDSNVLTPSHFLLGRRAVSHLPYHTTVNINNVDCSARELNRRYRYRRELQKSFWNRWTKDYLLQLRSFHERSYKRGFIPRVGDVVLVNDPNRPRLLWKSAVVVEHIVGRDKLIRSCVLRLPSGDTLKRPVQLLYPLEVVE